MLSSRLQFLQFNSTCLFFIRLIFFLSYISFNYSLRFFHIIKIKIEIFFYTNFLTYYIILRRYFLPNLPSTNNYYNSTSISCFTEKQQIDTFLCVFMFLLWWLDAGSWKVLAVHTFCESCCIFFIGYSNWRPFICKQTHQMLV